jgi:hypothetical protein
VAGVEPSRFNEGVSGDLPKVTGFADFRMRGASWRYDTDVSYHLLRPRGEGRVAGSEDRPDAPPISGSHEEIAAELAKFAEVGISHLQVVLDPIDEAGVEELAEIIALL